MSYETGPAYVSTGTDPAYAGHGSWNYSRKAPAPGYPATPDPEYTETPQNPAQGYDQGIR